MSSIAGDATPRHGRLGNRLRLLVMIIGIAAIVTGAVLVAGPIWSIWHRASNDQSALQTWQNGGSNQLAGSAKGGANQAKTVACGSSDASQYALVTFDQPAQYHYAGVAANGTWDDLTEHSMVHYTGTPDPGQPGNVIIAFHREPDYEHIDQLNTGDLVSVQDRSCHTWQYRITDRWEGPPGKVDQLVPTSGHELTLITCTPFWQDYNRLVWRAELVTT